MNDNTLPIGLITERLRQFRGLVCYDKMMSGGEIMADYDQSQKMMMPMGTSIEMNNSNAAMINPSNKMD